MRKYGGDSQARRTSLAHGPRRILMVLHEDPSAPIGGMGVHVDAIARRLAATHDVVVIGAREDALATLTSVGRDGDVLSHERSDWCHTPGRYRLLCVENRNEHFVTSGLATELITLQNFMHSYIEHLRNEQWDVIHLHDSYLYPFAQIVRSMSPAPLLLTVQLSMMALAGAHPSVMSRWSAESELLAYAGADHIISVSHAYEEMIRDRYLVDTPQTVIYNGIDVEELRAMAGSGAPIPGMRRGRKTVGFIGRCVPQKGVRLVIECARRMPAVNFVLFARPPAVDMDFFALPHAIEKYQTEHDNLLWFRSLQHAEHWPMARSCDVALMPSRHESFGIVALEWMALGIPLVVARVAGLTEFCDWSNTLLVELTVDSVERGVAAALAQPPNERVRMVKAARATAARMDWQAAVEQTARVYEEVICG